MRLHRTLPLLALLALPLASSAADAQTTLRGRLHVVWDGEATPASPEGTRFWLVDEGGRATELLPGAGALRAEALEALDRTAVEARGAAEGAGRLRLQAVRAADAPVDGARTSRGAAPPAAGTPLPFVTLLCRYGDDPSTPFTKSDIETVMGTSYPGVQHFYDEIADAPGVLAGTVVAGWYTLPKPRSAYVNGSSTNTGLLAQDCTAAADADVRFTDFYGVNIQMNGPLGTRPTPPFDVISLGGSFTLNLDGQQRVYGMTWLSGEHSRNYVVVPHEIGHALGWPHSSGRYGQEYDSNWDVMSRGYLHSAPPWGSLTIHTVAGYKWLRGWIPESRRLFAQMGEEVTGTLVRSALPPAHGYRAAQVPLGDQQDLFVELRRVAGYDTRLPAEAVVMHEVQFQRAYVLDPDQNGNPNDEGAIWRPGETYADSLRGVEVALLAEDEAGMRVRIRRGWRLAVEVDGEGTVSDGAALACTETCAKLYTTRGRAVTLTATGAPGWTFAGWDGACTGETCALGMGGERRVRAVFVNGVGIVSDSVRPAATMGAAYRDSLKVAGVVGAPAWSVAAGALPPGVVLGANGALAGVPEEAGTFRFTARAVAGGAEHTRQFRLAVEKPALQAMEVFDALLGAQPLSEDRRRFLDLLGNRNGTLDVGDVRAWLAENGASLAQLPPELRALVGNVPSPEK